MNIPNGIKGKATLVVKPADTALTHGSGNLEVFATPAMVALMEKAAWTSITRHLPKGYTTVGTEIQVKHIKATAPGDQVEATSTLQEVQGKKLIFQLEAADSNGKIGFGTHTRYVVEETSFMHAVTGKPS